MKPQRGAIPITLILYAVGTLVAAGSIWWVIDTWRDGRAAQHEIKAALAECPADIKDKGVADCVKTIMSNYAQCLKTVEKQNKAISGLIDAEKEALGRAKAARQAAAKAQASTQAERNRLAALQQGSANVPCTEAVQKSKEGLRP